LKTDHVVLRLGFQKEVKLVQRIFREYVEDRRSKEEIVRRLNREGVPNHLGRPWTIGIVDTILRNENFIGNTIYNRESFPLHERKIKNPPGLWIRTEGSIAPAVDRNVFLQAQKRLTYRWLHLTDDELLLRLRCLLEKEGRLNERIINAALGVPAINVYCDRFGSLRNAYRQIGYELKRNYDWIDCKDAFKSFIRDTASDLVVRLKRSGLVAHFAPGIDTLKIDGRFVLSLRLARSWRGAGRKPIWTINRRAVLPTGHILGIRLGESNDSVLDYLLLPTDEMASLKLRFMEAGLSRFDHRRFRTSAQLGSAVLRLTKISSDCASATTRRSRSRSRERGLSKRKSGCGSH
jgi:recombinase